MNLPGKLIVFEGADEVGKSTLVAALESCLRSRGDDVLSVAFPGREPGTLGAHVYKLYHQPEAFDVGYLSPESIQLLHIASHLDVIHRTILPALLAGKTVILDRFWWSTLVYGIAAGGDRTTLEQMIVIEKAQWGKVQPAIVFFLARESPLQKVPDLAAWHRHQAAYQTLVEREMEHHPVTSIANEDSPAAMLQHVLKLLKVHKIAKASVLPSPHAAKSVEKHSLHIHSSRSRPTPTPVFDTYWRFAAERQAIFFRKIQSPLFCHWTRDPILSEHKFTNAYRASDRVSQYLIQEIAYSGDQSPEELFFRIILFKIFNRIDTWELLVRTFGEIRYSNYSFDTYDRVLSTAMADGKRIYSAAYIMTSGRSAFGSEKKHRNHLRLLETMMRENVPARISKAKAMRDVYEILLAYPTLGPFLAFQYTIDLNYSTLTSFDEMEFVVPGPGALDGIRKCFSDFGGFNEADLIRFVTERQQIEFDRLGLAFPSLWGRPLQLIDCQNLFCEVDKYARVKHPEFAGISGRTRIKQKYRPKTTPIRYWYPPRWNLNDLIAQGVPDVPSI